MRGLKWHFVKTANNGSLRQVGNFGERLLANLLRAKIVTNYDAPEVTYADIFNYELNLAAQVKMCNHKHAQRPRIAQIAELYDEKVYGHVVLEGIYGLAFYHGGKEVKDKNGAKKYSSKIKSKKLSPAARMQILAEELQFVYLVDIRLIRYIIHRHPEVIRNDALVCEERRNASEALTLYITRTFLKGFVDRQPLQNDLLKGAFCYGRSEETKGKISEHVTTVRFRGLRSFQKKLPVFIIGRGDTVKTIEDLLKSRKAISMTIPNPRKSVLAT